MLGTILGWMDRQSGTVCRRPKAFGTEVLIGKGILGRMMGYGRMMGTMMGCGRMMGTIQGDVGTVLGRIEDKLGACSMLGQRKVIGDNRP